MGDFNFPSIDWNSFSAKGLDGAEFSSIQATFLKQYVYSPTREGNILDHVLNNECG